jgi:hypothetical protein
MNTQKSTAVIFTKRSQVPRNRLKLFKQEIPWLAEAKYLGIHLERRLTWKAHIKVMENKAVQRFVSLYPIFKPRTLNRKIRTHLYKSLIRPILLYGAPAWGYAAKSSVVKLQVIQNKILRNIDDGDRYTSNKAIHIALDVRTLNEDIKQRP